MFVDVVVIEPADRRFAAEVVHQHRVSGLVSDEPSPRLGVAALWSRSSHPLRRGAGFGVISGVLLGEGIYGLAKISDTTDWRYWSVEIAVAAGIVGLVALRYRSVSAIGSCIAVAGAAAAVVYIAAVSA